MDMELGQLGQAGLIEDVKSYDLPPNVFSDTLNVEFDNYVMKPILKPVAVFDPLPETREPVAFIQGFVAGDIFVYLAACEDSLWLWYMGDWSNITPAEFNPSLEWNLFSFNGYLIAHSPNNYPFYLDIYDFQKPLEKIPSWPEAYFCKYLFGYSGFLIGLGLTSSDGHFDKQIVFWSNVAELGQLPSDFDFTNPESRAGFAPLEGAESFICAKELQNFYVIYREKSIYNIRFVGGNSVFAFERKVKNTSLLNRLSVVEFNNLHFFIGKDNFYVYDGFTTQPIGGGRVTNTFFKTANLALTQVQLDADLERIFIYYGLKGDTKCTYAYVMPYTLGLFFKREVNGGNAFSAGYIPTSYNAIAWEDLTVTWDEWEDTWEIIYQDDRNSKILWMSGNQPYYLPNSGEYLSAYARRTDLALAEKDQAGVITVHRSLRKLVKKIWPELNQGSLNIAFGTKAFQDESYAWNPAKPFDPKESLFQNWTINSKFISLEFNNLTDTVPSYFELTGFKLEVVAKGKY